MLWKMQINPGDNTLIVEANTFDEALHTARRFNREYSIGQPMTLEETDSLLSGYGTEKFMPNYSSTTAPRGWVWYMRGSIFNGTRERILLKDVR